MLDLYKKFYVDRNYEQLNLFKHLAEIQGVRSVIYPGSFVHIAPSFFIPYACYIDSDKQAAVFFKDIERLTKFVQEQTKCNGVPTIRFYGQDYSMPVPEQDSSFDLLISQYAGFVCEVCKRYLKPKGLLLVNNSHGDAGIAALDTDFKLCGVYTRREDHYTFSEQNLEQYFVPKKKVENLYKHIHDIGRGIAYTKTATLYLFQYAPIQEHRHDN